MTSFRPWDGLPDWKKEQWGSKESYFSYIKDFNESWLSGGKIPRPQGPTLKPPSNWPTLWGQGEGPWGRWPETVKPGFLDTFKPPRPHPGSGGGGPGPIQLSIEAHNAQMDAAAQAQAQAQAQQEYTKSMMIQQKKSDQVRADYQSSRKKQASFSPQLQINPLTI